MYIIPIAWLYVALMMAVAEATNSTGTVLGGIITFLLYGLAPVALVVYLMGSPARRRAIKTRDATSGPDVLAPTAAPVTTSTATSPTPPETTTETTPISTLVVQPDASGHASAATQSDAVAPVRKEA